MGCCVSSENGYSASASKKQSKSPVKQSRAPPPSSMEEETVKEVLSETPTPKPHIHLNPPKCQPQKLPAFDGAPDLVELGRQLAERVAVKGANVSPQRLDELKPKQNQAEEISEEVSDICSLSESVSISTATNLTDDSGVVHHHRHHQGHRGPHRSPAKIQPSRPRSFSGEMAARRDQTAQSQLRRPEQSPRRRNAGPVRPSLAEDPTRMRSAPRRRERDLGESSARRSRSPAVNRAENPGQDGPRSRVGRSPSVRRTNPSPGRVRSDPNERRVGRDLHSNDNDNREGGGDLGPGTKQANSNGDESADLDNPLVSLECFIFL